MSTRNKSITSKGMQYQQDTVTEKFLSTAADKTEKAKS